MHFPTKVIHNRLLVISQIITSQMHCGGKRTQKFDFCQTRVCGLVSAPPFRVRVCGLVCGVSAVFRLEVC